MGRHERPFSRFTREKTQAAMYAQHMQARYALVPNSRLINAICYISCATVEETALKRAELLKREQECDVFLSSGWPLTDVLKFKAKGKDAHPIDFSFLKGIKRAVILGRSSDFYHYGIDESVDFSLVIAGLHDSMINLPVWETYTNKRFKSRDLALDITGPGFLSNGRKTQYGHNILIGALICGYEPAIALKSQLHIKTRQRIEREVQELQTKNYRGRPLAFWNEEERLKVAQRISYSLIEYHRQKKA
jgi:hypothetical protein